MPTVTDLHEPRAPEQAPTHVEKKHKASATFDAPVKPGAPSAGAAPPPADEPPATEGCACGCVLQEGPCGIKRDANGDELCVCAACKGDCSGSKARDTSQCSEDSDGYEDVANWCEDCYDLQNESCKACSCCGIVHRPDGRIYNAQDGYYSTADCTPDGSDTD